MTAQGQRSGYRGGRIRVQADEGALMRDSTWFGREQGAVPALDRSRPVAGGDWVGFLRPGAQDKVGAQGCINGRPL